MDIQAAYEGTPPRKKFSRTPQSDIAAGFIQCALCNIHKPLDAFPLKRTRIGTMRHRSWCKSCWNAEGRSWHRARAALKPRKNNRAPKSDIPGSKFCPHCQVLRSLKDFTKSKHHAAGCSSWCSPCRSARSVERRKEQQAADPKYVRACHMLKGAKDRAKKFNVPCTITVDDLMAIMPDVCPVLGIPLDFLATRMCDRSPSLDRFYPELGYVRGKVFVISNRANRLKMNATVDEIRMLLNWMTETALFGIPLPE